MEQSNWNWKDEWVGWMDGIMEGERMEQSGTKNYVSCFDGRGGEIGSQVLVWRRVMGS